MSDERFAADAQRGVELARAVDRAEPLVDTGGFASKSCQPACKRSQRMDEQQDLKPLTAPGQAVLHALPVAMGFEVAERQLDLHPARVEIHQLPCTWPLQFG